VISLKQLTPGLPSASWGYLGKSVTYTLLVLAALAMWLRFLVFPSYVAGDELDLSWMQSYGYFFTHRLQAGKDYIFTYGPLGYFWTPVYDADLFWYKYCYELVVKLIAVVVILKFAGYLPNLPAKLLFCAILVVLGWEWIVLEQLVIFLLGIIALKEEKTSFHWWVPVALLFAVFSLVKFTLFVLAVVVLVLVALDILGNRGRWAALRPPALFAAGFCLVWLALGQSLSNLPRYLGTSLQIAGGYAEAMAWDGNMDEVYLALLILAALGVALVPLYAPGLPAAWRGLGSLRQLSRLALLGATVFLQWKHGFTRHDAHSIYFFSFMLLLPFLLPALFSAYDWAAPLRVRLATTCFFLSLIGLTMSSEVKWTQRLSSLSDAVAQSGEAVLDPSGCRSKVEEQRAAKRQEFALPLIKARVGGATVDLISYEQGVLFLNGMNWRPRPVFQGYSAYTPDLLAANVQFFRSADAPQYLLFKVQSADDRFPTLDDGPALLEILRRYQPVLVEKGYLLLERHRDPGAGGGPPAGEVVLEKRGRFGEEVDLRGLPGNYHTLALKIAPSWRGRLRSFFYRPPEVRLRVVTAAEEPLDFRLIPAIAEGGFILSPLLRQLDDVVDLYGDNSIGGNAVASFSVTTPVPESYADEIAVTVRSFPRLVDLEAVDPVRLYQIKHPGAVTAGAVTSAGAEGILGWAWDLRRSADPVRVDVYADGVLLGTVLADQFRQDVADARVGDGRHGFSLATPDSLKDGKAHAVQITASGTDETLAEGALLAPAAGHDKAADNFAGSIDGVDGQHIVGWAWDSQHPNTPLDVDIYVDDAKLAAVRADQFRVDLRDAGIGDGKHGFDLPSPPTLRDGKAHAVRVKIAGTGSTIVEKGVLLSKNPGAAVRRALPYAELVKRIQEVVRTQLPPGATVLVASKGDDDLLKFDGRTGQHFPQDKDGVYDGNPADGQDAVARLEALRAKGAQFLLLPEPSYWWLEHYKEFKEHLDGRYARVYGDDCCIIYRLSAPGEKKS
jgi:hypothetical protein